MSEDLNSLQSAIFCSWRLINVYKFSKKYKGGCNYGRVAIYLYLWVLPVLLRAI